MKKVHIVIVVLFFGILNSGRPVFCQYQPAEDGYIKEDSMNLAIFVLDFQSYDFIEANVHHYALCDSCDSYGLPFSDEFIEPMDFGSILFKYTYNNDTLFYASIVWAGAGYISYPGQFHPATSYESTNNHIPIHEDAQYYDYWLIPSYCSLEEYRQKADSAWRSIDSLLIVNEFADYSYRLGFYAYTPEVGIFNPGSAKWIVFLYYGNDYLTGIPDTRLKNNSVEIYPNPSSGTIRISNSQSIINSPYEIINTQNVTVSKGCVANESISLSDLNDGMYIIRIKMGNEYVCKKIILVK
ncbi:MAG: T9SS type A sorting domain-containing protein [Bacteroidales bacterium]|nr:T9SS type A sorting domain-containing protein [Bacteroidales bacterium]